MINLAKLWRKPSESQKELPDCIFELQSTDKFAAYYDEVQMMLKKIAGLDEMLSGSNLHCNSNCVVHCMYHQEQTITVWQ